MSAAKRPQLMSPEDYLAGELVSAVKHEYVEGLVYAMAGARNSHNDISVNVVSAFRARTRGTGCRTLNSDVKIRISTRGGFRFYYPDAGITCRPNPRTDSFEDNPVVIAEVLSPATRRIDEGEKRDAYFTLTSLSVYLLLETDRPLVIAHRRSGAGFTREEYQGIDAVISLPEVGAALTLAEIYDEIVFEAEPEPGDVAQQ